MNKAVFFSREGVFNKRIFHEETGQYGAPRKEEELKMYPGIVKNLKTLLKHSYSLFILSNQPDYALGYVSEKMILTIEADFKGFMIKNNVHFQGIYYCHHHPQSKVKELALTCKCRKPSPFFILKAAEKYKIDLSHSWMVGDCGVDIQTGKNAGVRTILLKNKDYPEIAGKIVPDYEVHSFEETVRLLTK